MPANSPASPRLLVIADDLTGANDTGVQFARNGIPTFVFTAPPVRELPRGHDVIVINTESRHLPPDQAAERVRLATERGRAAGVMYFYKKTDSTLRGNLGSELEALLRAADAKILPFVPAFPDVGRTTRAGVHHVHGQPISETAFAHDPMNPIRHSEVAAVLRTQSPIPVRTLRAGDDLRQPNPGFWVFDCETTDELRTIAFQLRKHGLHRVLSGSAALAGCLPELIEFRRVAPPPLRCRKPILLVNGSVNERALRQIGDPSVASFERIQMRPEWLVTGEELPSPGEDELNARLAAARHKDVLLFSIAARTDIGAFHQRADQLGMDARTLHLRVAENTGKLVGRALREGGFGTLIVFGGDTLMGIARACHWEGFVPLTEAGPGLTVAQPQDSSLTVISKAGGFGEAGVIGVIQDFVRRQNDDK